MILFHGTIEENIKNIKKVGLLDSTNDPWILEVTKKNVCCVSNQPTSGEGGSPIYFAGRHERANNQNGYLVVISLEPQIYTKKLITIFDNKVLDDYARHHYFTRKEFLSVGYDLYKILAKIPPESINKFTNDNLKTLNKTDSNENVNYYKEVSEKEKYYALENIEISNNIVSLVKHIGSWETFYSFLACHFNHVKEKDYQNFLNKNQYDHNTFWKKFYEYFPCNIDCLRQEHMNLWFSHKWLEQRQLSVPNNNCQILVSPIEPEHIVGFIHITNSSGVVPRFRPIKRAHKTQAKYTLAKRIWREVYRMTNDK